MQAQAHAQPHAPSALSATASAHSGARLLPLIHGSWCIRELAIMGTLIRVELWADDRATGERAIAAVMDEMHRIDLAMSPHKPASELSRINRHAFHEPVPVSAEMVALLGRSLEFSALSDGAFDITYASVGHLYDYRRGIKPSDSTLAQARAGIGWQKMLLNPHLRTVRFAHPRTQIDLGGFAKGHAVNNAVRILREHGIQHAMVAAGGDSRLLGDRRGRPWMIAVRDPRRPGEVVAVLPLEDTAISTSGDYERFFLGPGGERHHHLIDPATGRSPAAVRSVTILADDGLTSEALSKCVFVLGIERGLALVESQPGVDAIVVDASGALHCSSGLGGASSAADAAPRQ